MGLNFVFGLWRARWEIFWHEKPMARMPKNFQGPAMNGDERKRVTRVAREGRKSLR
jgi:hypothetical protein